MCGGASRCLVVAQGILQLLKGAVGSEREAAPLQWTLGVALAEELQLAGLASLEPVELAAFCA